MTYNSVLLGVPVARVSVLSLADLLASSGRDPENRCLRLESHDEEGTVLAEETRRARRFRLGHGHWPRVQQLCRQPGCRDELYWHRTLCDRHMKAAGAPAVREQTRLVAEGLHMDRDGTDFSSSESMRQLMEAALAVGIPAAEHARYFAERLHLPDADCAEDWDYDEHEHDIRRDEVRLLLCVGQDPQRALAPTNRGSARQIGPLDPLQLPGSPEHLKLDFSCTTDGMSYDPQNDIQYWQVGVHHRPYEMAPQALGQVGRLALLRTAWRQDLVPMDAADAQFDVGFTARTAYEAVDDPKSPVHQLGVGEHGDLLILLNVELDPPWRGFGLGAFLTRQALHVLGQGCRMIGTCVEDMDSPAGHLVRTVGFHPVDPRLAVLDRSVNCRDPRAAWLHRHHFDLLVSLNSPERSSPLPF